MGRGQDASGLSDEMHTAEDYVIGFGTGRGFTGQEKTVALGIGVLDNLFPLIMMA